MKIYANLLGNWVLLNNDNFMCTHNDMIHCTIPESFINQYFFNEELYSKISLIDIVYQDNIYTISKDFIQIVDKYNNSFNNDDEKY